MNDILTIAKEELIDILTKSGHYHEDGIKIVLDRGSLADVLKGIMCDVDSLEQGKEYYKSEVRCLRCERKEMEECIDMLESKVEAAPVRHGRWLLLPNRTAPSKLFRCSECGNVTEHKYFSRNGYYYFCKDCGAKMDKTDGGEEK